VADGARCAVALLLAHGYAPTFASWVLRLPATSALPSAAAPVGFLVRALRAGEERAVFALIDQAFSEWPGRKGLTFDAWQASWLARPDFDPSLLLAAENEHGELAGALHAIHFPTEGWIQQLAVAPAYRRRGLARALLSTSFAELLRRGAPVFPILPERTAQRRRL
jgi:GNAT superfamily N-acetyltransferase